MTDAALHLRFLPPRLTEALADMPVVLIHGKVVPISMLWEMS